MFPNPGPVANREFINTTLGILCANNASHLTFNLPDLNILKLKLK